VDRESVRRLVLPLLEQAQPGQWRPAAATSGYALFLRTKPASPPTK
jgi:hypothetical protein